MAFILDKVQHTLNNAFLRQKKLTYLVHKYKNFKKNCLQYSGNQRIKYLFYNNWDEIFGIAHKDALIKIRDVEDKAFLLRQREDRS